jgi:hypothetical protein
LKKKLYPVGIAFKGPGFYSNDYKLWPEINLWSFILYKFKYGKYSYWHWLRYHKLLCSLF